MVHGIPWSRVVKMMIDAPNYADKKDKKHNGKEMFGRLTKENSKQIMDFVNKMM